LKLESNFSRPIAVEYNDIRCRRHSPTSCNLRLYIKRTGLLITEPTSRIPPVFRMLSGGSFQPLLQNQFEGKRS
jgi:hypothetical protein